MAKKVLILCNDFPPINSIGADRPYSWYKYFKEFDLEPIVITKNWISDGNDGNPKVDDKLTIEKDEFGQIIRVSNCNTFSTIFHRFFGNRLVVIRKLITLFEITLAFNIRIFDRHRNIYYAANNYLNRNDVDFIIATGEPFILLRYATLLGRKNKIKSIVDFRDGWYLNHKFGVHYKPYSRKFNFVQKVSEYFNEKFIRNWEFIFEKKVCKLASEIITVDPEMAFRLSNLHRRKVGVIYNGFWNYHDSSKHRTNDEKIIINHTGTLAPGQEIEIFLDVLLKLFKENLINEKNFQFNLIGLEYFPDRMRRLIPYSEMIGKVVFTTPRLKKEEAIRINISADYLILFTDPNLSAIYAKTYDYIACRKPIIVVPGDKKQLDTLIKENNLGFILRNSEQIAEFILTKNVKSFSPNDVLKFTRKKQAEILSELILSSNT